MTLAQMSLSGAAVIAAVALIRPFAVDALPRRILPLLWGLALARLLIPVPAPDSLSVTARMTWVERVPSAFQAAREVLVYSGTEENTEKTGDTDSTENTQDTEGVKGIERTERAADTAVTAKGEPDQDAESEESIEAVERMTSETGPVERMRPDKTAEPEEQASATPSRPFPVYTLWGAGTGTLFLLFASVWLRFRLRFQRSWPPEDLAVRDWLERWICHHELHRPVSVRVCGEISGPLTYGILRPVILLPSSTDWADRSALEFVLYHELVHIRRFDAAYKLALAAVLCLHWCNPCVWLLYTLAGRDLELSCDEAVVRRFGQESRLPYVNTLLDMESRKSGFAVPQFSARAAQERVAAVMKTRPPTLPARLISCVLALAVGLLAVSASPPASAGQREELVDRTENPAFSEEQETAQSIPAGQSEEPAPIRTIKVWTFSGESYETARENVLHNADRLVREVPVSGGVLLCVEQAIMRDFRGHGVHQFLKLLSTDGTVTNLPMMLDADKDGRYENILLEDIRYNRQTRTVTWNVRTITYPDGETDTCSYVWELGSSVVSVYAAWEAWEERAVEIRSDFESSQYTEKSFQ